MSQCEGMATTAIPYIEKFRVSDVSNIVHQTHTIASLCRLIDNDVFPNCLFYGPPGSGKTSTARGCARRLNGANFEVMLLELNASNERSIPSIRQHVKAFAGHSGAVRTSQLVMRTEEEEEQEDEEKQKKQDECRPSIPLATRAGCHSKGRKQYKIVLLDEADQMPHTTQFAVRRLMEIYSRQLRFILTANHLNKVIPAIRETRCTPFQFEPLPPEAMRHQLMKGLTDEKLSRLLSPSVVDTIVRVSNGDMRACYNLTQNVVNFVHNVGSHAKDSKDDPVTDETLADHHSCREARLIAKVHEASGTLPLEVSSAAVRMLLNTSLTIPDKVARLHSLMTNEGLSLLDLVACLQPRFKDDDFALNEMQLVKVLKASSSVYYAMCLDGTESVQLGRFVGVFATL